MSFTEPRIRHFDHNYIGNDYIVGDLHGCLDHLISILEFVQFDNTKDRLFSVGDIIDRGPKSLESLNAFLNNQNWFMTLGNHEILMINSLIYDDNISTLTWLQNGGSWINNPNINKQLVTDLILQLLDQPVVITVGHNKNRFNIVHAELVQHNHYHEVIPFNDSILDNWLINNKIEDDMLWGRTIYDTYSLLLKHNQKIKPGHNYHSNKLSTTYVGHTIQLGTKPIQIEKQIYLDTGTSFMYHNDFKTKYQNSRLSVVNHSKQILLTINKEHNIHQFNMSSITKINT